MCNFLVITGPSRESVERYRNNFAVECDNTCILYDSRVRLNKGERDAAKRFHERKKDEAKQFHERKKEEAQKKQDDLEAELWWKRNKKKFEHMKTEKSLVLWNVDNSGLRFGVRKKLRDMIENCHWLKN